MTTKYEVRSSIDHGIVYPTESVEEARIRRTTPLRAARRLAEEATPVEGEIIYVAKDVE